jgi:hypothetical protein
LTFIEDKEVKTQASVTRVEVAAVLVFSLAGLYLQSDAVADTVVGSTPELVSALALSAPGERITVLAGAYELNEGLSVPGRRKRYAVRFVRASDRHSARG